MLEGQHFVVTEADGTVAVYANVRNAESFRSAAVATGRKIRAATDADLDACGITAAMERRTRQAGVSFACNGFILAKLPAGSSLQ